MVACSLLFTFVGGFQELDENLIQAARTGQTAAVRSLVASSRANVDAQDTLGWTVLMIAALNGNADLTAWLLSHGADPERQSAGGATALTLAASRGHLETVRALVDFGVNLDRAGAWGLSAYALAARAGHGEVVALLAASGAETIHIARASLPVPLEEVESPRPIRQELAVYPESAKAKKLAGEVVVEVVITKKGKVLPHRIVRSPAMELEAPAVEAVREWRFEPGRVGAKPVDVIAEIVMSFQLL